jgi:hypothetical protein
MVMPFQNQKLTAYKYQNEHHAKRNPSFFGKGN